MLTARSALRVACAAAVALAAAASALAQPAVEHNPTGGLPTSNLNPPSPFGGASTQRSPAQPREEQTAGIIFRVCCQNGYNRVAVYLTSDGTEPQGSQGVGTGTTTVLTNASGQVAFLANEFNQPGGVRDWWRANVPTNLYGQQIRYKISRFTQGDPASEVFHNGSLSSAGAPAFEYTVKLAWPGQGSNFPGADDLGYPPFHAWKEEGVIGNGWINAMLDQNGNIFDVYYPGAGGVQGVGTRNEGYVSGLDTFPALLPPGARGQMHINQILTGLRVNGTTYWLSNQNGTDFLDVTQAYVEDSNAIRTTQRLHRDGVNLAIEQMDFAPEGVAYPTPAAGTQRGMLMKRMRITNNSTLPVTLNAYMYMDPALNGGDTYDAMFVDNARGAMVAFDNTYRVVTGTGCCFGAPNEYNPTTFPGYEKNVSIYLAGAMKVAPTGGAGGTLASDSWRDSSPDNGQGWIGQKLTIDAGETREVSFLVAGGFDAFAGATGTYAAQVAPVVDWFQSQNVSDLLTQTNTAWENWLASGTTVDLPDQRLETLFKRGLLATALHIDERNGGLIAGFRNGAYPYVWPRDAAWAGVTLARAGHHEQVAELTRFLRDVAFRDFEPWGRKGFWKQKYTTDGYTVWGAPQVDETAVVPWMVKWYYDVTADQAYLSQNWDMVKDAAIAMSQTSGNDGARLNLRPAYPGAPAGQVLIYSNNIWEDSYDTFLYSNANVIRGLRDARFVAQTLGFGADASDFQNRESGLLPGFFGKLDWNRENTDISLLGVVYPFEVIEPNNFRAARIIDRINGVAPDGNGAFEPLVRFAGQYINDSSDYAGLIDRYWGDSYWGNGALGPTPAGPWFLTTMWYGAYYAMRQDFNPGTGDIDNHLFRLNRTADHNGPIGLGAEQMAPSNSLQYPGQSDFTLQTAWPNAWESMSFYVDAMFLFLEYRPDAANEVMRMEPKIPGAWTTMTFNNLEMRHAPSGRVHRVSVTISKDALGEVHTFTNNSGDPLLVETVLRSDLAVPIQAVTVNGSSVPFTRDSATGRVLIGAQPLATGAGEVTVIRVVSDVCDSVDFNNDGVFPDDSDVVDFIFVLGGGSCATCNDIDFNNDGVFPDDQDLADFLFVLSGGSC